MNSEREKALEEAAPRIAYYGWAPKLGEGIENARLYRTTRRGRAMALVFLRANERSGERGAAQFADIRVRRAPEFDDVAFRSDTPIQHIDRSKRHGD